MPTPNLAENIVAFLQYLEAWGSFSVFSLLLATLQQPILVGLFRNFNTYDMNFLSFTRYCQIAF